MESQSKHDLLQSFCEAHHGIHVMDQLSGIGSIEWRLQSLKIGFRKHLKNMEPANPLRHWLEKKKISDSPHFILPRLEKSEFLMELEKQGKKNKNKNVKKFLKEKFLEFHNQEKQPPKKLVMYQTLAKRNKDNSTALFRQSSRRAKKMIQWRLNVAFTRNKCKCELPFNRGHLNTCEILEGNEDVLDHCLN
eukprot:Sdes_comp20490_c0_seq2m14906